MKFLATLPFVFLLVVLAAVQVPVSLLISLTVQTILLIGGPDPSLEKLARGLMRMQGRCAECETRARTK